MRDFLLYWLSLALVVIGGIGRVEGPIIGAIVFFALRQVFAVLGSIYLMMLGLIAIGTMLWAPKGLWGIVADRFGWQLLPLERRVVRSTTEPTV